MGLVKKIGLILITLFIPPIGVFLVAGCGADLLINILLTILGYFPGHIHAFYIEYVYFRRRDEMRAGVYAATPAPGVYSSKVQRGGLHRHNVPPPGGAVAVPVQGQQYGTI
ncbi:UPF0057-domain-containing protein [Lentithecium fluviatile CBS 122367]|uniref:UPF0057-domain-containing protein n=1 Tax=Lentithecium fluviatile CBS 122367 TaxID=1168545 RepID=A0A6G1J3M1_9PLEO|nr:UPF0057-domain-containing protein [Lentithecium fluviatile CBS 122367]